MPDYFFDTSVVLAYFKNEDARCVSLVKEVVQGQYTAAVSVITVAEVWASSEMKDSNIRSDRLAVLALMQIVPIDTRLAEHGGIIKGQYASELPDALIAASCHQVGGRFFAKDRHFHRLLTAGLLTGEILPG